MITYTDFYNSIPLIIIASASLLVLIIETVFPNAQKGKAETVIFYFSLLSLLAASYFVLRDVHKTVIIYNNYIKITPLTGTLDFLILLGMVLTVISSREYLEIEGVNYGEYYSLLVLATLGMMLMLRPITL